MKTTQLAPKKDSQFLSESLNRGLRSRKYSKRGIKPQTVSAQMPTPFQLANIAATLSKLPDENPEQLCSKALSLWFAASETIGLQKQCNKDQEFLDAQPKPKRESLPLLPGSQFPMDLDYLLALLWPKKNTADRAALFKIWIGYNEHGNSRNKAAEKGLPDPPQLTKDEITEVYTAYRQNPIGIQAYHSIGGGILRWYQEYSAGQTSKARHGAGKASAKRKVEKLAAARAAVVLAIRQKFGIATAVEGVATKGTKPGHR